MLLKSLILSLVGVFLVTFSVFAGTSVLKGVVKDAAGHPIKGADVRIEAKNFYKILKTDASGHYVTDGLAVGTYKVMLVINGQVKALFLDAKTQFDKPTQLNFDLGGRGRRLRNTQRWFGFLPTLSAVAAGLRSMTTARKPVDPTTCTART